jgi:hypothetical protein
MLPTRSRAPVDAYPGEVQTATAPLVLEPEVWGARQSAHRERVAAWVEPHLARRRDGVPHPVEGFLFTYYSQRPAALMRWHPGHGVGLRASPDHATYAGYVTEGDVTRVADSLVDERRRLVRDVRALLVATAGRAAHFGCFGMHEWAMVYRLPTEKVRHASWPLRLGGAGTDEVVESHRIACSHFDAFRFFTDDARPRNTLQPGRDDRPSFEQPACLHAGMDLYKHAFRLSPLVPSALVDARRPRARDLRALDMRASPYDLRELGYEPVPIETPEGKAEYVAAQRGFADRGAPLRRRLIDWCEHLSSAYSARDLTVHRTQCSG